eukprot:jgi/Chrzof1/2536/Cz11g19090.t1
MAEVSSVALWQLSAAEAVEWLRCGKVSPLDLIQAAEARWKETEPLINAMPITCWEQAKQQAKQMMEQGYPDNPPRGYLYGLPVAIKDLTSVAGLPYIQGCVLFKKRVGVVNDPLVDVLLQKGAIIVGKTNTPEFGAGSHTFNDVFGTTYNPWHLGKSAGGSSGGSAAALAAGQVWLATGTDLGGSLRNPASFCGVVGMRPSIGLVHQHYMKPRCQEQLRLSSVSGPMARSVTDLAIALDAMVECHPSDPVSRGPPPSSYQQATLPGSVAAPHRVAWSPDLGGITPVDAAVAAVCADAVQWFNTELGAEVVQAQPDLAHAAEMFRIFRALQFADGQELLCEPFRSVIKPELVWQIQQSLDVSQAEVEWAVKQHDCLLDNMKDFFNHHDLLCCPAACVAPFNADIRWPQECEGVSFTTYIDWLLMASAISLMNVPSISIPCGFTAEGLPVGIQLVGPPGGEAVVLAAAAAFEKGHDFHKRVPVVNVAAQQQTPSHK